MTTLAQLEQALINADRAGRTEDAQILAAELRRALGRDQRDPSAMRAQVWEQLRLSSPEESNFIEDVISGFGSGVVNTGEMAALGSVALLEEENELAARKKIQSAAEYLRPEGGDQDALSYQIASGLGSVVGTLGAAAGATYGAAALGAGALGAGIAGLGVAGAISVGAGAGDASERARAAGTTEEKRNAATLRGAFIGSLDILPFGRILKIPGATKLMGRIGGKAVEEGGSKIRSALTTGGAEAAQEAASAFLQNMNERGYNPEKELLDAGIIDEAIAGGGAGVIIQGVVDFFIRGRAVDRSATDPSGDPLLLEWDGDDVETRVPSSDTLNDPLLLEWGGDTETLAREAEASALEAQALEAADRGDEATFEQASAEAAQPDMFTRELQEARAASPEAALRGQLESQGERVPQQESITDPVVAPAQPSRSPDTLLDRLDTVELDDAEIVEIEALIRADEVAVAELDVVRGRQQQYKDAGGRRTEVLKKVLRGSTTSSIVNTQKAFVKALEAEGIKPDSLAAKVNPKTKLTKREERAIKIHVGEIKRKRPPRLKVQEVLAEPEPEIIESAPEDTQLGEMEARIPERAQKPVTPSQMSFTGMGRKKTPAVKETPPAPNIITKEFMDGLGVAPSAPIRKRTEGKDLNDPTIREQFVKFANNKSVPEQTRLNVARNLEGVPDAQLELFQPKSRKRTAPAKGVTDATTGTTQPTPSGASVQIPRPPVGPAGVDFTAQPNTEMPQPLRGRGVANVGSSVSDSVRGEGAQQPTLDLPEPIASPKPEKPKRKTKKKVVAEKVARKSAVKKKPTSTARKVTPTSKEQVKKQKKPTPTARKATPTPKEQVKKKKPAKVTPPTPKQATTKEQVKKNKKPAKVTSPALETKEPEVSKQLTERFEQQPEPVRQVAQHISREFNETVGKEITTPDDQLKIFTLLTDGTTESKARKALKAEGIEKPTDDQIDERVKSGEAVITYLRKVPRPVDGLYIAVFDVANATPEFKTQKGMGQSEVDFFRHTGHIPAQRVLDWAKANLSAKTNTWIDETLDKEIREHYRIESTNYVDMFKQREAKLAVKEMAEQAQAEADIRQERQDVRANLAELARTLEKKLERGSVVGLDMPLHPGVRGLLRAGNLKEALATLAATTADKRIAQMANKLAKVVGDTKVEVVKDLKTAAGEPVAGLFDPETNTIKLDSEIGMNPHVLIHEMTHAAASATLSNKSHPLTRQLTKLFEDVKGYLDTAYGAKDVDEFLSEAMSNPEFQAKLAKINPDGSEINALQRFFNSVGNFLRKLVGMQPKKIESAQTVADRLIDGILAPAPQFRNANELAMESTAKGVKKEMDRIGSIQKMFGPLTDKFRGEWADGMFNLFSSLGEKNTFLRLKLVDSQALGDIAKRADAKLGKLGTEFHELMELQRGSIARADDFVRAQVKVVDKWVASGGTKWGNNIEKQKNLNDLIYSQEYGATIYQVDPTKKQSFYEGKTDESGNDLEAVWKAQRADWNALGADGQKVYHTMRNLYRGLYVKLKDVVNGRIDAVLSHNPDAAAKLKKEVFAKLFDSNQLDVYFPLLREGPYKLEFQYNDKTGKSEADKYVFQMFDSKRQRDRILAELKKDPDVVTDTVRGMDGDFKVSDFNNSPPSSFVKQVLDSLNENGVKNEDVQAEIMRLFINALPESSFAKSLKKRENTPGYMQDAVYAMKSKGYDLGRQIEKLKYSARIQIMEADLDELKPPKNNDDFRFNTIREEIRLRMKFAKYGANMKSIERYVRTFNQLAFVGTIGFNTSSAMVQMAQTPLFTYPMLGARYGYKKAYNELMNATKLVTGARANAEEIKGAIGLRGKTVALAENISIAHGLDSYYDITDNGDFIVKKKKGMPSELVEELERIAPLVRLASERGYLNQSFIFDAMALQEGGRARKIGTLPQKLSALLDWGTGISAMMFNQADRFNRQTTMVAAYNLALGRISTDNPQMSVAEQQKLAAVEALYDTQAYNGGSTLETSPSVAHQHIGRVAAMYKTYGLTMYNTMLDSARDLLSLESDKEARKIALKQIVGIHLSSVFFAGVHGIPLYGAAQMITDWFLLDDEDNADDIVRDFFGEGWFKGPFNQILDAAGIGADVASRVRLTGLLLQENRYNPDPSAEEFFGYYLGGPALSVAKRVGRGIDDIVFKGETQRGIENMLPVGVSNAYKALGRYQQDGGIYSRRTNPIYDDMTSGELVTQFFGFAPAEYLRIQEEKQRAKRIDLAINKERSGLTRKYYVSARRGDWAEIERLKGEILKFNKKHPSFELDEESIVRSLKQHGKTTEEMYYGVSLSPIMRRIIKEQSFGDGFKPPTR